MTLAQLRNVYEGYVKPGYLRDECAEFNRKYAKDIERGKKFKMSENLYALDMFVVKPTTAPNGNMKATIRETACTPPAPLRSALCDDNRIGARLLSFAARAAFVLGVALEKSARMRWVISFSHVACYGQIGAPAKYHYA